MSKISRHIANLMNLIISVVSTRCLIACLLNKYFIYYYADEIINTMMENLPDTNAEFCVLF